MPEHGPILVVVDPTAAEQPALERAVVLAKPLGAPLELFICDDGQPVSRALDGEQVEHARRRALEAHTAKLEALKAPLAADGIEVKIDVSAERPLHAGIVHKAEEVRPLLIAKDTHQHPVLRRTLLSNTDWNLIRACRAPLLLVKPRRLGSPPKVLAGVDPLHEHDKPADLDRAILAFAAKIAQAIGGSLHVLHTFDTAPLYAAAADTPLAMTSVPPPEMIGELESRHREALERLLSHFPVERANVRFDEGAPHHAIVQTAEDEQFDIVVMGAVSRSGLQRIFVGSTAERVLDRLPCDLIVVKYPELDTPHGEPTADR